MVTLLAGFAPEGTSALLAARSYYDFVLKLLLANGIAFVLPVLLVVLNFARVLSWKCRREWRSCGSSPASTAAAAARSLSAFQYSTVAGRLELVDRAVANGEGGGVIRNVVEEAIHSRWGTS